MCDQKTDKLGHSQNIWANVAGDCLHLVQMGSTEGYIFARLALERWSLYTTLNWIRLCLAQIEEPWILYIASFHSSSVRQILRSSCQVSLFVVIEVENYTSFVCKPEMVSLCSGSSGKSWSTGFCSGREGKEGKFLRVKLRTCRYLKKWALGILNWDSNWAKDKKQPSTKRSLNVKIPFFCHSKNAWSFRGWENLWFLATGAQIEPLCHPRYLRIWAQIWMEFHTIGCKDWESRPIGMGENRRAESEEGRQV